MSFSTRLKGASGFFMHSVEMNLLIELINKCNKCIITSRCSRMIFFLSNISGMWLSANTVKMFQKISDLNQCHTPHNIAIIFDNTYVGACW